MKSYHITLTNGFAFDITVRQLEMLAKMDPAGSGSIIPGGTYLEKKSLCDMGLLCQGFTERNRTWYALTPAGAAVVAMIEDGNR